MRKQILTLSILLAGLVATAAPKAKSANYKVDGTASSINWLAKKVTGQHGGTIAMTSGALTVANDNITGGSFVIDMNSIKCTDLTGEWADKLIGHLRSDDFFSVEKNPTAQLTITKVNYESANKANIDANLTIKGITKAISFPSAISKKGDVLVAVSTIRIDRTKFDIKYGSKSFFESIGDKAIEDEFEITVNLVAKK
jgi:polyisoprenoid-binding protein YceI